MEAVAQRGDERAAQVAAVVRAALVEHYGVPVLRVGPGGRVEVPAGGALQVAGEALERAGLDAADVSALDLADDPWCAVPAAGLQLWRALGSTDERVTELVAGDPGVQVVAAHEGWRLVRTADGAQGWVEPAVELVEGPAAELAGDGPVPVEGFVAAAEALLGAPYVWGGTGGASGGVDCSGLVQRAAWQAAGAWLPRHSTALLTAGSRVAPSVVARGDVLVLKRDLSTMDHGERAAFARRHPMHVAIAVSSDEALHASRDAMAVVREPLAPLRARYRVLGVRRLTGADTTGDAR